MRRKTKFFFCDPDYQKAKVRTEAPHGNPPPCWHYAQSSPFVTFYDLKTAYLAQAGLTGSEATQSLKWPGSGPMGPALSQDSWPAGPDSVPEGRAALPRTTSPNGLVKVRLKTS